MKKLIIKLIEAYQQNPSFHQSKKCRFLPTCSEYSKECFKRFNFAKASFLSVKRIIKCNPLHKMEYDPVPEEKKYRYPYKTLEDSIISYEFINHKHKH